MRQGLNLTIWKKMEAKARESREKDPEVNRGNQVQKADGRKGVKSGNLKAEEVKLSFSWKVQSLKSRAKVNDDEAERAWKKLRTEPIPNVLTAGSAQRKGNEIETINWGAEQAYWKRKESDEFKAWGNAGGGNVNISWAVKATVKAIVLKNILDHGVPIERSWDRRIERTTERKTGDSKRLAEQNDWEP